MSTQPIMNTILTAKAQRFAELHRAPGAFLIANAWDVASARILEGLGFPALATSSGAAAALLGRRDGQITRDEALAQASAMTAATSVPFAGDLENGFGHAPADAALTIRRAAEAGLVGGSIEDASNDPARSTTLTMRSSGWPPLSRRLARCRFRSPSRPGPRTS